jgi:hypothetical protein
MKKFLVLAVAAVALAGCNTNSQTDRTLGGAAIGAGTGALIGAATGGGGRAVATGALIGAGTGAVVGAATTPRRCVAYDDYGRRYRVPCP